MEMPDDGRKMYNLDIVNLSKKLNTMKQSQSKSNYNTIMEIWLYGINKDNKYVLYELKHTLHMST